MAEGVTRRVARAVYRVAVWLALPLAFAYFFWRGRCEPAYRECWRERLGIGERMFGQPFWIHAVSVGEGSLYEQLVRAVGDCLQRWAVIVTPLYASRGER